MAIEYPEISSELEKTIYTQLKKLQKSNTILHKKVVELQTLYNKYSIESNRTRYHHAERFGFLKGSEAVENYRELNRKDIMSKKEEVEIIQDLDKMYNLALEISRLLMNEKTVEYAIYYSDPDGKIYRSYQDDITDLNILDSKEEQSLRIMGNVFKQAKLEAQTKRGIDITEHYKPFKAYLHDTYKGKKELPNSKINEGIISEAFERHLQNMHASIIKRNSGTLSDKPDWSEDEPWRLIRQSLGNDPWYTGGDVGTIQVKSIINSGARLTRLNTIEDIVNFLVYLSQKQQDESVLRRQTQEIFKVMYNEANSGIDEGINLAADQITDEMVRICKDEFK